MLKKVSLLLVVSFIIVSCGGSSGRNKNSRKPVRTGENITSESSRLAQNIANKIYCSKEADFDEEKQISLYYHISFFGTGMFNLGVYNDADTFLGETDGEWGASESSITLKYTEDDKQREQTGGVRLDLNGDLIFFGDGEADVYYECGAVDSGSSNDSDDQEPLPRNDEDDVVIPTIPSYDLTLLEIIKGNLFCEINNEGHQLYFAIDNIYTEATMDQAGNPTQGIKGKWSLEGNILNVYNESISSQMVLQYTREGILKLNKNTIESEYKVCY